MPIRIKLILLIFVSGFLASSFAAYLSLMEFNKGYVQDTYKSLSDYVNGAENTLNDWARSAKISARFLADNLKQSDAMNNPDLLQASVRDKRVFLEVDDLAVVDASGVVCATDSLLRRGTDMNNLSCVRKALSGKESVAFEIIPNQGYSICTAVPVYHKDSAKIAGCVFSAYKLGTNKLIKQFQESYNAENSIFSGKTRVASTLKGSDGKTVVGTDLDNKAILDLVLGKGEKYVGENVIGGKKYLSVYSPLRDADEKITGMIFLAENTDLTRAIYNNTIKIVIPAINVFLLLIILILSLFVRWFMWRISNVTKFLKELETGEGDLTKRCKLRYRDEIGELVIHFDLFLDKLQHIIREVKETKEELTRTGDMVKKGTEDTSKAITGILVNIEQVNEEIKEQTSSVNVTTESVSGITSNIHALDDMIEDQSASISQASTAVEQMIGNIGSVNQSVEKMASSFESLSSNASIGFEKQQNVNERIQQIESQSELLVEANQAIANIAEQTNLLAMNAAIEAAHAGDAGKGFSVVADEIRKLSETSGEQTQTITKQLSSIRASISDVYEASSETSNALAAVSERIQETDELVMQISGAMQEQTAGSKQIGDALHSMMDSSSQVINSSKDIDKRSEDIAMQVNKLENSTSTMHESMLGMTKGADRINEAGNALGEISDRLQSAIQKIGAQIDTFKV